MDRSTYGRVDRSANTSGKHISWNACETIFILFFSNRKHDYDRSREKPKRCTRYNRRHSATCPCINCRKSQRWPSSRAKRGGTQRNHQCALVKNHTEHHRFSFARLIFFRFFYFQTMYTICIFIDSELHVGSSGGFLFMIFNNFSLEKNKLKQ